MFSTHEPVDAGPPMAAEKRVVEARSFDHVPESERTGAVGGQLKFWFMVNATLITALTGAVGPLYHVGLSLTLIAIVAGTLFGTLFQAFHGAQGPHMGLPQMIQSRVQFGSRGAVVPIAVATILPLGFAIFYIQTGADAAANLVAGPSSGYQIVIGALAGLLAIIGYRLILKCEGIIAYVVVTNLIVLTVAAVTVLPLGHLFGDWSGDAIGFLAQFGASAIYQLAIAPIVSDYTRYLPSRTRGMAVSAAVFAGTVTSAVWIEFLGAAVALSYPDLDVVTGIRTLGNAFGFGMGPATMVIAIMACLVTAAISFYSGSVSLLSAVEAFRPLRSTPRLRAGTIAVACVAMLITGLTLPADVLTTFSMFLNLLGYLLIPWTAVNLTDYYLVRRGVYSITDILKSDGGIYGLWGRRGLISYGLGFVAMIPFFSTTIFTGPVASMLGGADISFAIGLPVASISYLLLMRRVDLAAEAAVVASAPLHTGTLSTAAAVAPLTSRD